MDGSLKMSHTKEHGTGCYGPIPTDWQQGRQRYMIWGCDGETRINLPFLRNQFMCVSHIHIQQEGDSRIDTWIETLIISYNIYVKLTHITYYKRINTRVNAWLALLLCVCGSHTWTELPFLRTDRPNAAWIFGWNSDRNRDGRRGKRRFAVSESTPVLSATYVSP